MCCSEGGNPLENEPYLVKKRRMVRLQFLCVVLNGAEVKVLNYHFVRCRKFAYERFDVICFVIGDRECAAKLCSGIFLYVVIVTFVKNGCIVETFFVMVKSANNDCCGYLGWPSLGSREHSKTA